MEEEVDGDVNVGWKIWRQTAEILYHFLGYCGAGRPRGGERGGGGEGTRTFDSYFSSVLLLLVVG